MKYYYDSHGWLTAQVIEGRSTDVVPPEETSTKKANWTGQAWVLVPYVAPTEPAPIAESRQITVGAFFDRFGESKWAILADSDAMVQALVKDCTVRKFIDLDRPDLPIAISMLVGAGHDVDIDFILSSPIKSEERV